MLKFPYGDSDFERIITRKRVYLDRTHHIPFIEEWGARLLFLRPRRFGKSLWLSTLMNYYDLAKADMFDELFGGLAIGKNPTPFHNQYLIMRWDFSTIESHGSLHEIRRSLFNRINGQIRNFQRAYQPFLKYPVEINHEDAISSFVDLVDVVQASGHKLYLFIDEYDNFANEIMMGLQPANEKRYLDLVQGEGLLKTIFKSIKSLASGVGLDRVFMTGVAPIVLNDVTSGANVFEPLTWHPELNDLCGFNEAEAQELVKRVIDHCGLPQSEADEVMTQMRSFYDGSLFITRSPGKNLNDVSKVYNPTLVFYFLKRFQYDCIYPEEMLDDNLLPDRNKLLYISTYDPGKQLLLDAIDDQEEVQVDSLQRKFGVQDILQPTKQEENLAVLLTYLGALTISDKTQPAKIVLKIPNLVMRKLYAERILQMITAKETTDKNSFEAYTLDTVVLDEAKKVAEHLFDFAELQPLCTFVEQRLLSVYDNRDYREFNELTLKTLFISLLHYRSNYIMDSEFEILRRYGDLTMFVRPGMRRDEDYDFLFEFKFVKLSAVKIDKKKLSGEEVRQKSKDDLLKAKAVKKEMDDAKKQLRSYQHRLQQKYGDVLNLRTFAVVGVGLDRVIWEEI